MRPLAFHPNVAPPQPSPPPAHGVGSASHGVSSFVAVLNGLDAQQVQPKPKGHKSDGTADARESIANKGNGSEENPSPDSPCSIEVALAALGYRTSTASADPGSKNPSPEGAGACLAPSTGVVATPPTRAPAPHQADITAAAGNIGADPADAAPLEYLLTGDPVLGLQGVRTRTHHALVDSVPAAAKLYPSGAASASTSAPRTTPATSAPEAWGGDSRQAQQALSALPTLQAQNGISSLAGTTEASVAASPLARADLRNDASAAPGTRPSARLTPAPSSPDPKIAQNRATSAARPLEKTNAVPRTPGQSPEHLDGETGAVGGGAFPAASDVTLATSSAALAMGTAAVPIPINQLADFVATEAASLSAEIPPATTQQSSASSAPQVIKELSVALDPADLGAVSIKMRLANGKLTVVIGAANASTRQAIESDRQAIVDRLASGQQILEALIVRSEGPTQVLSGGNDASDSNEPRQSHANGDPASAERGAGGESKFGRGRAPNETFGSAAWRGRSGDLVV
jgi:flagellar hook-length control protein FliK